MTDGRRGPRPREWVIKQQAMRAANRRVRQLHAAEVRRRRLIDHDYMTEAYARGVEKRRARRAQGSST